MDLIARAISRDEVPARIRKIIAEQKRAFPVHSFGDIRSPLSLDAAAYRDGDTALIDTISTGLWE